jgi:ABC-2 type transport system permease protein
MMIRPFLYDFRRTITSKSVLILIGIILLISLAIIPFTAPVVTSFRGSAAPDMLYYRDPSAFHFIVFSSDQYGQPVQGTQISMRLSGTQTQTYVNTTTTNAAGYAFITLSAPNGTYYFTMNATRGGGSSSFGTYLNASPVGLPQLPTTSWISTVQDKANASKSDVRTFYAGLYGAKPSGYSIRYKISGTPPPPPYKDDSPYTAAQMDLLGNLTDYRQVFDPTIPNGLSETTQVYFELFAPNGTAVSGRQMFVTDLRQHQFRPEATNVASFFFSTILSFFMPLAAILGAYSSYGKDRLTGVLESILARPISRRGLAISRFLSTLTALSVAAIASVGIVDLLLNQVLGTALSQDYTLAIISGLIVEVAAFTGLIFLLSHLVKSTGVLLGISIVLFVVLDFFWGLIVFLLTLLLGGTSGSAVAVEATLVSYYANPAQFLQLINVYVFQSSSGIALQSSNYGVTLPAIVLDGILWATLPFLAFLYLAVKRD